MAAISTTGTLTAGNSRTFVLAPGSALTLTLLPNCRVTVTETPETVSASDAGGNSPRTHSHQLAGVVTYGPYAMGGSVVVANASNSGSTVTWGRKDTVVSTDSTGTSLVSGDGTPLDVSSGVTNTQIQDALLNTLAFAGAAMPTFWLGILLVALFAVHLGWLPAGGEGEGFADGLRHLVLPAVTLAFHTMAHYLRQTRAAMIEALREPYIRTARAKGAGRAAVVLRHAAPNAAAPVLTIASLDAASLVSGALVTEAVFARPGMGKTIYDAILGNDYNLALLCLLLSAAVALAASLVADLVQRAIDPRIGG